MNAAETGDGLAQTCFHCGAPLRAGARSVMLEGQAERVCGQRCASIVARIAERGLSKYYAFRSGPGGCAGDAAASGHWSVYDRTAVQKAFVANTADGARLASLLIDGLRCAACAWLVEEAISVVPGVRGVTIDPLTARASIVYDPGRIALSRILEQIADLGFRPYPFTAEHLEQAVADEQRRSLRRLIVAGLGMMQVGSFAGALYLDVFATMDPAIAKFFRLVSLLVATPVVLYSGAPFFSGAWRTLRHRRLGMDVPVALAIGAAYLASVWNTLVGSGEVYFDSCTMFVFLLSLARYLERAGRQRALNATRVLASRMPHAATRRRDGTDEEVGVLELEPGDIVLVKAGAVVPADGELENERVHFDESLVTGESTPVTRRRGEPVLAGSLTAGQPARIRVTGTGADTTMARISALVTDARQARPAAVEVADRRASLFIAIVLAGAGVVGLYWGLTDPARAFPAVLAVLVVTCPCALALATPAAFTVATSALARSGFLVRRAGALTSLAKTTDLVLDKTGTLTVHSAGIAGVTPISRHTEEQALGIAAILESWSEHPLARAFPKPARADGATEVEVVAGQGIAGTIDGVRYRIGRREFAAELCATPGGDLTAQDTAPSNSGPVAWLGSAAGMIARFDIAERYRADARETVSALRDLGVAITIASGDQKGPVAAAAARVGVAAWHAGLLPPAKLALVRSMQDRGAVVAMVGDGLNDAPVLAGANVSIAIGSGTALAHHSADCVLMTTTLAPLTTAIRTARQTMRVIRQNLAWSAAYNLIALPLAGSGILTPWMAALGMSASSLLVICNALRLSRARAPALTANGVTLAHDAGPSVVRDTP